MNINSDKHPCVTVAGCSCKVKDMLQKAFLNQLKSNVQISIDYPDRGEGITYDKEVL